MNKLNLMPCPVCQNKHLMEVNPDIAYETKKISELTAGQVPDFTLKCKACKNIIAIIKLSAQNRKA